MIRPLRLAHTSDIHLFDGEEGMPVRAAFAQVIDAVLDTRAEIFLVAGDLFDHNRIHGDVIEFVYEQLARLACPAVIISGNHDCWGEERAILKRMDFRQAGHHITLLDDADGASVEFPELHATVWGRCMLEHSMDYKPMAGAPPRTRDLWHIGMAHGLYVEYDEPNRSSLITPQEIADSGFDYLAMGHVHLHQQFRHGNTLACYPGVPVPYFRPNEACLTVVELKPGEGATAVAHPLRKAVRKIAAAA